MKINHVNTNKITYTANTPAETKAPNEKKERFLDNFHTKIINSADMDDCVWVPRTIFKGYLGIMTGTIFAALAPLARPKHNKLAFALNIISGILCTYGTFSFIRPYVIKGAPGVKDTSKH